MEKDMKNKYFCYIVLALFLFALLFQMMNVTLYFDDYGYLSLTYHKLGAGVNNGRYILINILQFLYNHYMNVGARVLYFFIFLVLGRIDISVMRLAQTAIIFFIIYIFAHHNKFCPYSVLTLVALYMALPLVIMSDGAYWFSASILYVFPMLPFLVGSILLIKTAIDSDKLTNCQKRIMYVSLFFASFSQEQISCATVFVLFICVALNMLRRRSIKLDSEISTALVITLIGFLLIVLCPGSRIRAAENQLPLLERIVKHSNSVILNLYHASGNVFQFPLIIITAFMGIFLYRKKAANIVYMLINTVLSAFLLFVSFKYYSGVYNGLATLTHYNWIVVRSVLYIYTLVIAVTVVYYCRYKKSLTELILFGGGIVSLAVIIAAPSAMPSRACLPYYIILIFILSCMAGELFTQDGSGRALKLTLMSVMLVISLSHYIKIAQGYELNRQIYDINEAILNSVKKDMTNGGEKPEKITLYKMADDKYGNIQPYMDGYSSVKKLVLRYYGLSEDIELEYKDIISEN